MLSRTAILTLLLTISFSIISEESTYIEYNKRALKAWQDDPSAALHYADRSLDLNSNLKNREEAVNSHYYKALAYSSLNNYRKSINSLNSAYKIIQSEKYFYTNSQFYSFLIEVQFIQGQYSEMSELLSNRSVVDNLDEKGLLIFNLYKLKRDIIFERDNIVELIENNITAGETLEYSDVLGEFYILYGDYLYDTDLKKSRDLYQRALDMGDEKVSAQSLLKLGMVYREWKSYKTSNNYLERAYLSAELLGDYRLTDQILRALSDGYKIRGDYKNLSIIKERENHFNKKHFQYLLKEQTDILDTNYLNQKLSDQVIESDSRITILKLVVISLGIITLFLTVFISILSYKQRVYKLGEH